MKRRRRIRKRRRREFKATKTFALLLASLLNKPSDSKTLINQCLNQLYRSLPQLKTLPTSFLSLLPLLLHSEETMRQAAGIVGAASLHSIEMNEQIALDGEIVKGLVSVLSSSDREAVLGACNAVLDMSTTSIGRQQLLEFFALEALMFKFLQAPISLMLVSLCIEDHGTVTNFRIGYREDELSILLLEAAIILINACIIEKLENIPRKLYDCFLVFLKELWAKVHNQMLLGNTLKHSLDGGFHLSDIRASNLAESIFRLSVNDNKLSPLSSEAVKRGFFGLGESSFETFMLQHWEAKPFLTQRLSGSLIEDNDIFSSVAESLHFKLSTRCFLSSILQNLVSCMPISSDEVDICSFLKGVGNNLGCPVIYQQDIRVVRTEKHSKIEVHFFSDDSEECCPMASHVFSINDILKCEEAYKKGYTIALRGMEFRFKSIAAIADGLASLFGQPSAGANLYLTPANSQGLACHYDDHCVFVCQLFGTKRWTVSSQPTVHLPRLYDHVGNLHALGVEHSTVPCEQFLVREGDILYIPRGFSHKACTDDGSAEFSLHLTFGIEVEPPFEWEGFAHIALYCWNQTQRPIHSTSLESLSEVVHVMSMNLLHAMISFIGERETDPTFRKACLAAALPSALDTNGWLALNQKAIFCHLIDKISKDSRFSEVLRSMEVAMQKNEDPFQRISWLQFLNPEREIAEEHRWNINFMESGELFPIYVQNKVEAEASFMKIKSKFCREITFENVIESYKILLDKYKKARQHYMNGMLSLHCKSD
ncbi:hypothetical protein HS088_TW04G00609 [Tripterygium wilfordii]|uniref:Bifunctional lysine-specific demethylase and histidyl-hydroxylase n=1 Tax=Tripterygium wilfordii TaxID=458696 RepID=A0A7J7DQP9_TRIWF|nr:uncharacterized protein LOC119997858 [Tripterygium wilfordii]KAF5748651.1 hypothetical protein HS088_TW04G00609 [Tripterygium wilfordii]